jgi:hypothetical protein
MVALVVVYQAFIANAPLFHNFCMALPPLG